MHIVTSVDEAIWHINQFDGAPEEFRLAIADNLFAPPGAYIALIVDQILARGWEPDGFVQEEGYRICRFKELN